MSQFTAEQYRMFAQDNLHRDGEREFDDKAIVSTSCDRGAYVQAWIWVYDEDVAKYLGVELNDEDEEE